MGHKSDWKKGLIPGRHVRLRVKVGVTREGGEGGEVHNACAELQERMFTGGKLNQATEHGDVFGKCYNYYHCY